MRIFRINGTGFAKSTHKHIEVYMYSNRWTHKFTEQSATAHATPGLIAITKLKS